jgi:hypothetical protein
MLATKKNNWILFSALAVTLCLLAAGIGSLRTDQNHSGLAKLTIGHRFPVVERILRAWGFGPKLYSGGLDHDSYDEHGHDLGKYDIEPDHYDLAPASGH